MAKQRKNAKKCDPAPAGEIGGTPDEPKHANPVKRSPAVTPAPAVCGHSPAVAPLIPTQDVEDDDDLEADDSDLDDEDEDEDEDDDAEVDEMEDKKESAVVKTAPALTVPNDDPQAQALLRGTLTDSTAGAALADDLVERDDPRGECVRLLVTAPVLIPPLPQSWYYDVIVVATEQLVARLQKSRLEVRAYSRTPLYQALARWGGWEKLGCYPVQVRAPSGGWTPETVVAALDRARRQIIFGLFGTTEEEVRCPPEKLRDLRVRRLVRLSRQHGGVDDVCAAVRGDAELREALLAALVQNDRDRDIWDAVMDRLSPGWRRRVASKRVK